MARILLIDDDVDLAGDLAESLGKPGTASPTWSGPSGARTC